MRLSLILFIFLTVCGQPSIAQMEKKAALSRTKNGQLPPDERYQFIDQQYSRHGLLVVGNLGKYGLINRDWEEVIPCMYDDYINLNQDYHPRVKKNGLFGWIDSNGKTILPAIYEDILVNYSPAFGVRNDTAFQIKKDGKWGRADGRGKIITPVAFDGLYLLNDGYIKVKVGRKWGVIDANNKMVIAPENDWLGQTDYPGVFWVERNNKRGVVDYRGNVLVPVWYERVIVFDSFFVAKSGAFWNVLDKNLVTKFNIPYKEFYRVNGRCYIAKDRDKWGAVDLNGNVVLPFLYDNIHTQDDDPYLTVTIDGRNGLLDRDFRTIVPCAYRQIMELGKGLFAVQKDRLWGCVNARNELIIPFKYRRIVEYKHGLLRVQTGFNEYCYIDTNDNPIIPHLTIEDELVNGVMSIPGPAKKYIDSTGKIFRLYPGKGKYSEAGFFSEGLAMVTDAEGYKGYINKQGTEIAPCIYEDAGPFHSGLAPVKYDGKWGYIDSDGTKVVDYIYSEAQEFKEGRALVARDKKYGFIDTTGQEVITCLYSDASAFYGGRAAVKHKDKWGMIDRSGKVLIGFRYYSQQIQPVSATVNFKNTSLGVLKFNFFLGL